MLRRLLALLLLPVFAAGGVLFLYSGFEKVQTMRRIERIPRVSVDALIPGEANVSGLAEIYQGQVLHAPDTGATCLYYRYTVERKTKDSDGHTSWETVTDDSRFVPFLLTDGSGSLVVYPGTGGTISLQSKHSRTAGDLRYNESRIDPGMSVFAMGLASREDGGMALRFEGPGVYVPILSVRSEEAERGSVGLGSLILTAIGLLLATLAMYALTRVLGIHMILAYLLLAGLTSSVLLTVQANRMLREDLRSAFWRLDKEQEVRTDEVRSRLEAHGLRWDGDWQALPTLLDREPRLRRETGTTAYITRQRVNLMRAIRRAEHCRQGFPERLIAAAEGLPHPIAFDLLPAEEEMLGKLEAAFLPSRISGLAAGILAGIGLAAALLLGVLGVRQIRVKRWIENIPTVKTKGVVYGLNEVNGTVAMPEGGATLNGPLSGLPCSCYHYTVKEKRRSGKKTEWVTITDEKRRVPFLCRDDAGDLPIHPDKAELIMKARTRKREGRLHYEEHRLPVGGPVYALGCAVIDPEKSDRLRMARGEDETLPFLLSDYRESDLVARKASAGLLLLTFGINAFSLAGLSLAGWSGGFGVMQYQAAALAPLVYMILFFLGVLYNDMVFLRRRCDAMWANIDVALKKRFDLLPSLVAAAKAYLEHEQSLQQALAQCRADGGRMLKPGEASGMAAAATAAVRQLAATVENYPDLKADQAMRDLMRRTRDLEDEVALMREGYNHAVELYNTRIGKIPDVLMAKLFRFNERAFFQDQQEP